MEVLPITLEILFSSPNTSRTGLLFQSGANGKYRKLHLDVKMSPCPSARASRELNFEVCVCIRRDKKGNGDQTLTRPHETDEGG